MSELHSVSASPAEDLFISLFSDVFGAEKAGFLYSQYHFYDIYQNDRFADFFLQNGSSKIAIEIDDEASHHPELVASDKFYDDLLKQNSMIYMKWAVYRWAVRQLQKYPETVKDELRLFFGDQPHFKQVQDYLPKQQGRTLNGAHLELRGYQKEALDALEKMRANKETIALLCQATGTGKTVTAVADAKRLGGRVLFVAHTIELVNQAFDKFQEHWKEVSIGKFSDSCKDTDAHVICGTIQSVALHLDLFKEDSFDYLIIDEAHHAASDSYQKVIEYFKASFTLGLTATPERTDDTDILETFKNTAHRLDIQTAVEIGALVLVRCIRIHTNIDMSNVRFNSFKYNIRELDNVIHVQERNTLIVKTWLDFVKNKRTVVFCVSVKHAELMETLFRQSGVRAAAVSGKMPSSERKRILSKFSNGELKVLCACDLLNEGWDCPQTEVLFMARPTMSKMLYLQQLGRGMRLSEGKNELMVFDLVDNANQFNAPYTLHRVFKLKEYHAGALVLGGKEQRRVEAALYAKGEKPVALIDYPVDAKDYEVVDIFNWQEEAAGMISQMEFVRRVDVQSETVEKYIREGAIIPDLIVPMSEHRTFKYFKEETIEKYANVFGWTLITPDNRCELFMEMIRKMDMSYSYKPVFVKAFLHYADNKGHIRISGIVSYFRNFYDNRRKQGLVVEKKNSLFSKDTYTDKEAERNILSNPFKRFEDMNIMYHTKTLGIIAMNSDIWKRLSSQEKEEIRKICDDKLCAYYGRI